MNKILSNIWARWRNAGDVLGRCLMFLVEQFLLLCSAVAEHFKPSPNVSGWRGITSRMSNLWQSGRYGKIAIVCAATIVLLTVILWRDGDECLVKQSGNHPKEWYDSFEEEPYGLVGLKGARPYGRDRQGRPLFLTMPALSEVDEAFSVGTLGSGSPMSGGSLMYPTMPDAVDTFPPASDRKGRIEACRRIQEKRKNTEMMAATLETTRAWNRMKSDLDARAREADRSAARSLLEIDRKNQVLNREVMDFNSARAQGMSTSQYQTYKQSPGFEQINPPSMYSTGPAGNPDLFRSPGGSVYEIDSYGNKRLIRR